MELFSTVLFAPQASVILPFLSIKHGYL